MPDGNPKYQKHPRPESVTFFRKGMVINRGVKDYRQISEYVYEVERENRTDTVLLVNHYVLSLADINELVDEFPDINTFVNMSIWNSISLETYKFGEENYIQIEKYQDYWNKLTQEGVKAAEKKKDNE